MQMTDRQSEIVGYIKKLGNPHKGRFSLASDILLKLASLQELIVMQNIGTIVHNPNTSAFLTVKPSPEYLTEIVDAVNRINKAKKAEAIVKARFEYSEAQKAASKCCTILKQASVTSAGYSAKVVHNAADCYYGAIEDEARAARTLIALLSQQLNNIPF